MNPSSPLVTLFTAHQATILQYRYIILFAVALIEGTGTMITAGVLIAMGIFEAPLALLVCTMAEIIDGFLWYTVGYFFGATPIEYFVRNSPARQAFMAAIRRHSDRYAGLVVLAVKLTYSVTNPTLILIGSLKYDIKRYTIFNIIGSVGWAAILLSLGYAFGKTAFIYLREFRVIGITVFVTMCSIIALIVLKESGNFFIKKVKKEVKEEKDPVSSS